MDYSLVFNLASLITSSYGLYKCSHIQLPQSLASAGQKQFLTNISLVATVSHNVVTLVLHLAKHLRGRRLQKQYKEKAFARATASAEEVHKLKDDPSTASSSNPDQQPCLLTQINRHVTLPLALVLESVVATVYWPLRIFAIHLILQGVKAKSPIPLSVDVSIHLLPILYLLSDYYISGASQRFKIPLAPAWAIVASIGLAYKFYLGFLIDPSQGQKYPYPFLDVSEPYKSVIFVIVTSFGWLFYVGYRAWPPKETSKERVKLD